MKDHFIVLQVGEAHHEDTTLEAVGGNFGSLGPCDQGLLNISDVEHGWCFHIIPVLENGSITFFLAPFLPTFVRRLFLLTAMVPAQRVKRQMLGLMKYHLAWTLAQCPHSGFPLGLHRLSGLK